MVSHNLGPATLKDYLPLFAPSDMEILTVPLHAVKDAIQVQELQLPNKVRKGQAFTGQAIVETDGSIPTVSATFYHNDIPVSDLEFDLQEGQKCPNATYTTDLGRPSAYISAEVKRQR